MDRAAVVEFFEKTFEITEGLTSKTRAVHGTEDFTAWEWDLCYKTSVKDDSQGLEAGEMISIKYVSLIHWVREGNVWKIGEVAEYAGKLLKG